MRTGYRGGARLLFGLAALLGLYLALPGLADHARAVYTVDVARSGPRFTRTNAGLPVVWRTCDSIPVLVNPGRHGMEAYTEIVSTMTDIGNTVGIHFSFSLSAAVPRGNWGVSGGGQIAPVLVGWVDAAETDLLAGSDVAGSTVANPGMVNGTKNIRTGAIALNSGIYEDYSSGEGGGRTRVNLITHEVGHLLGLDHSSEGIMRAAVDEKAVAGFTQTEITFLRDNMPACGRDMPTP